MGKQGAGGSFEALRQLLLMTWQVSGPFIRGKLAAALVLIVLAGIFTALGPVALKAVVDSFGVDGDQYWSSPLVLVIAYVLTQWLARSASEFKGLVYARAERRMARILSEQLFGHIMRLPLQFHLNRRTGAISQSLVNGLDGFQTVLHSAMFMVLPIIMELATTLIVLTKLDDPAFVVMFLLAIVSYAFAFYIAGRSAASAVRAASQGQVEANASMVDNILNYETVKYFTAEKEVGSRVSRALAHAEEQWVTFYRRLAYNGLGVASIFGAFLGAATLYAAQQVATGNMTLGTFVLINTYMLQIAKPIETLGYAVQNVFQGMASLEGMADIYGQRTETGRESAGERLRGPGHLRFQNVTHSYDGGKLVLQNVTFDVPAGKTLGIVGGSGAGKSTILRLLVRLMEPSSGCISLDGISLSDLEVEELRQAIAVVPQDVILLNDTIGYNIGFGSSGSSSVDIERAATLAQLDSFIRSLPHQYETNVGERGVKVSGGERQRIAIARAALKRPRIYVFDEATSSLDSRTEREILRNIREISRESTTLIIAHRLSSVVHADEILVMDQGTIVERGTHEMLLRRHGFYFSLWRAQQTAHVVETAG